MWNLIKLVLEIAIIIYIYKYVTQLEKKNNKLRADVEEIKQLLSNSTDRPEP